MLPSGILDSGTHDAADRMNEIQWGGLGAGFVIYEFEIFGFPALIGIGTYLETQWGSILLLLGWG